MSLLFVFDATATTAIYTLSLHDALPISDAQHRDHVRCERRDPLLPSFSQAADVRPDAQVDVGTPKPNQLRGAQRSEEHTSELQSLRHLVCRLLLEKKNKNSDTYTRVQYA